MVWVLWVCIQSKINTLSMFNAFSRQMKSDFNGTRCVMKPLFFPDNQLPVLFNFLTLFFSFLLQLFKLALVVLDLSVLLLDCLLQLLNLPFPSLNLHSLVV